MKLTPTKRFNVRTALVTGTSLATIIGAQALTSLDKAALSQTTPSAIINPVDSADVMLFQPDASDNVSAAAPNIVILRHAGRPAGVPAVIPPQSNTSVVGAPPAAIVPPNPVQVAPPQAVVQQIAPVAPVTRSSR
ncbi:hypothetical protein [Aggregatilinea lenta]|uniref:hypothetical protein n=1 Tax=Aggregatilinea lenta TaxID=913108 RepID=UPI000E5B92E7|nr:hypothetical protein [Aggregatilinea lenta]